MEIMDKKKKDQIPDSGGGGEVKNGGPSLEHCYPWTKCVMGCTAKEDTEVVLLNCYHVICSEKCSKKFLEEIKPGASLKCRICNALVARDQLEVKVVPKTEFKFKNIPKFETPICEICVFDRPANSYCPECPACLCEKCAENHPLTRMTQKHKLEPDLSQHEARELQKQKDEETKCKTHEGQYFTHLCSTCDSVKVCKECFSGHDGHTIHNIQEEKDKLKSEIECVRKFMTKCDQAVLEIQYKREAIMTSEWNNVMTGISKEFAAMMSVLLQRQADLRRNAKEKFLTQLATLNYKTKYTKMSKESGMEFVTTGENILDKMDDATLIKFTKRSSDGFLKWFSKMDKTLTHDFEAFVDKNWHFQVDTSATISSQTTLNSYCDVEYVYKPPIKMRIQRTYSGPGRGVKPENSKGADSSTVSNNTNNGKIDEEGTSPRGRRFAVKSTAMGAGSIKTSPRRTYAKKDVGSQFKSSIISTPSPSAEKKTSSVSSSANEKDAQTKSTSDKEADGATSTTEVPKVSTPSSSSSFRQPSTTTSNTPMKTSENESTATAAENEEPVDDALDRDRTTATPTSDCSTLIAMDVDEPTADFVSSPSRSTRSRSRSTSRAATKDSESDAGSVNDTTPQADNELGNASSGTEKSSDAISNETSSNNRNVDTSEASTSQANESRNSKATKPGIKPPEESNSKSAPENVKLGMGKRERKRKSVPPGFVDTEQLWGSLRKELDSPGPSRRKLATKMPRLGGPGDDDDDDFDTFDLSRVKSEVNGQEDDSSDVVSEAGSSSSRRQSLRARGKSLSREPEQSPEKVQSPPVKRGRGRPPGSGKKDKNAIELVESFQEAPLSTVEDPPKTYEYPVHKGAVMKLPCNMGDDNEDYCCICLDGGDEIIVCCDFCPKVFHLSCHIPTLSSVPDEDGSQWRCNYDTTREMILEEISKLPAEDSLENESLIAENKKHFMLACKFVIECYKIPEIPTIRWKFPRWYQRKYGTAPFNMKYIRERLCFGRPEPFSNVREMLLAFKQMFAQAFLYYQTFDQYRPIAHQCYDTFLSLTEEYYPEHHELVKGLLDQ